MYISCPECNTRFVIRPNQIGRNGRNVKCSKCFHIWHQKFDENVKIEPVLVAQQPVEDVPLGNGVNLPALLPIKIPFYMYSSPVILFVLIGFILTMMFPEKVGLDTMLSNKYLHLKDINIENKKDLEKIVVSYKVLNSASKSYNMPLVRVRLYDKNNRVIKTHIDDHSKIDLAPAQHVLIKTEFVPAPEAASSVDIMIGNKLDFFLR